MTYGQIRDAALRLMGQYSLSGEQIPETYNNQKDALLRLPELVDDAQCLIAAGPRRIRAAKKLLPERGKTQDGMARFTLPEDLMEQIPGGLLVLRGGSGGYDSRYLQLDERRILLPDFEGGAVWLEYYRRPERVTDRIAPGEQLPSDDLLLDNAPETHRAIPYYAAAHLLLHEDAFAYAALMNEWQTQLLSLYRKPQPRRSVITDAYHWEAFHV